MGIFQQFPYTNFHEMNLDWILNHMKEVVAEWAQYHATWDLWQADINAAITDLKNYVDSYFDDLDVQDEINNKIDSMVESGEFTNIILRYVDAKVKYFITDDDFTELEGLTPESLYNWDISTFYALYDNLPLARVRIGYGSDSAGNDDVNLPIYAYTYNPPSSSMNTLANVHHCVFTSGIHGNEKSAAYALYYFMKKLCDPEYNIINDTFRNVVIHVIPICNPYGWNDSINNTIQEIENNKGRYNARSVDLNRNFPQGWTSGADHGSSAGSEKETIAIMSYINNSCQPNNCIMMFDFHTSFNGSEVEYTSQLWFQHQAVTMRDSEIGNDVFNSLVNLEKTYHDIDITNQFLNITAPTGQYNGQLYGFMTSIMPSFNGVGLFEGGKRYAVALNEFVYNDHRNIEVYIDCAINTLCAIYNHKKGTYFANRSALPLGIDISECTQTSLNRVQCHLGDQLNGNYLITVDNKEYKYNIMFDNWAGNIGFGNEPRIWSPGPGHDYNLIFAKQNDTRVVIFDLCAEAGIHFVELP